MTEVRLTRAAETDLIDIWIATGARWGPAQADSYLDDIDRALRGLADHPLKGRDCSELLPGARRLITGRHVAFCRVLDSHISVIRVLHQSMDLPSQLTGP